MDNSKNDFFSSNVLGHPAGLFVLFFTEMWERFSYYGMRAILVLFLVSAMGLGGWDWPREDALALYGTYTALVYLTPILGGYIADKFIGYRWAVVIGAFIMTLGHASMAIESSHIFLYIGIGLLIAGNGFFKPNMTSIISHMYKGHEDKKDGAYTIFYMGVNAGAFLGIMLCGYLGETLGWSYGFGLAGIFMFLGMLQFYFAQNIFGDIGKKPAVVENEDDQLEFEGDYLNPFSTLDKVLIAITATVGLVWVINDPLSKIADINVLKFGNFDASNYMIIGAVILFIFLLVSRIIRYPVVTRDRMIAIIIFAVFTVLFWASFEQAGGSMTIFAKDYTSRILSGGAATTFNIFNTIITVVPIAIISWVLYKLTKQTFGKYALSNVILISSFVMIWGIVGWMLNRNLKSTAYVISYSSIETSEKNDDGSSVYQVVTEDVDVPAGAVIRTDSVTIREPLSFEVGQSVFLFDSDKRGDYKYLAEESVAKMDPNRRVVAQVAREKQNEVEIPASWFGILNSLFIILFAPLFSKWWESKYNPNAATKYGLGLVLLGIGFAALAFGSLGIEQGAKTASVSIMWLVFAYLFHTLGELCLSPRGTFLHQ